MLFMNTINTFRNAVDSDLDLEFRSKNTHWESIDRDFYLIPMF